MRQELNYKGSYALSARVDKSRDVLPAARENVAVLYGGTGSEADVSRTSARLVGQALAALGYPHKLVEHDDAGEWQRKVRKFDAVLVMMHGGAGENGQVQSQLQALGVPYTGTGTMGSSLGFNKYMSKHLWVGVGGLTSECLRFHLDNYMQVANHILSGVSDVILPVVVKPIREGSSNGLTMVEQDTDLLSAMEAVLTVDDYGIAEPLLTGKEFTLGFLDRTYLGAIQIMPKGLMYDRTAKYDSPETQFTAWRDKATLQALIPLCERFIDVAELEGPIRFDFRMHAGRAYFLEVNTVPGMTDHSLLPMAAQQAGMSYTDLVDRIVQGARLK